MSDHVLKIIPTHPTYCCDDRIAEEITNLIKRSVELHYTEEPLLVHYQAHEHPEFVDCGSNLESITCPFCGKKLDFDWWGGAMNEAYSTEFYQLDITTPCCGKASSLNDLNYYFSCGFACCEFSIYNPKSPICRETLVEIEKLLGTSIKLIDVHI